MKRISITHIGNRHNEILRALNFYKQEFNILKGRLTEIAGKNTGDDVSAQVEHFENQFKVQTNNIDALSHNIHENVKGISSEAQSSSAGYIDGNLAMMHEQLEKTFDTEEKVINDLRHEFNRFSAQWM